MELLQSTLKDIEQHNAQYVPPSDIYVKVKYPNYRELYQKYKIEDINQYENYNLKNIYDDLCHLRTLLEYSPKNPKVNLKKDFLIALTKKLLPTNKDNTKKTLAKEPIIKSNSHKLKPLADEKKQNTKKTHASHGISKTSQPTKKQQEEKSLENSENKLESLVVENNFKDDHLNYENDAQSSKPREGSTQDDSLVIDQRIQEVLQERGLSLNSWKNYLASVDVLSTGLVNPQDASCINTKLDDSLLLKKLQAEHDRFNLRKEKQFQSLDLRVFRNPSLNSNTIKELSQLSAISEQVSAIHDLSSAESSRSNWLPSLNQGKLNEKEIKENEDLSYLRGSGILRDSLRDSLSTPISFSKKNRDKFYLPEIHKTNNQHLNLLKHDQKRVSFSIQDHSEDEPIQNSPKFKTNPVKGSSKALKLMKMQQLCKTDSNTKKNPVQKPSFPVNQNAKGLPKYIIQPQKNSESKLVSASIDNDQRSYLPDESLEDSLDVNVYHNEMKKYKSHQRNKDISTIETQPLLTESITLSQDHEHESGARTGNTFRISQMQTLNSFDLSAQKDESPKPSSLTQVGSNLGDSINNRDSAIVGDDLKSFSSSQTESLNARSMTYSNGSEDSNSQESLFSKTNVFSNGNSLLRSITAIEYHGRIKRICLLGGGSEARVYLCKMKEIDELVALKQYDFVENQKGAKEIYSSLKKEFHMLRNLTHESIIQYICLFKPKKLEFENCLEFGIIMEYMPGGSLESYIEENHSSMTFENKLSIMKQILSGLDYLHQNNIIHRDLKPGNILLSNDKTRVKITDFGISIKTNNDSSAKRTLVGTPWYMAPEVINQESYSSKADIWSAGCCFFHLIVGKKPYASLNAIQALMAMVNNRSPLDLCDSESIAKIREHQGLEDFLKLCFSREKSDRPTAATLLSNSIFEKI